MNKFIIGDKYRDRGPNYKRFSDDEFSSWLVDNSNRTIPPIGGIRFKQYTDLEMYSAAYPSQRIPPYIILMSTLIDTEFDNPWSDIILPKKGKISYWGDANGKKNDYMAFSGNRALANANFLLKNSREIAPPVLHFSKVQKGTLIFNGLCCIEDIVKEEFSLEDGKKVDNLKCHLRIFQNLEIDPKWLVARANSYNPAEADRNHAPEPWIDFINTGKLPKPQTGKARSLIWNDKRNTVLMWILYHKGFSIADDSNPGNKIISKALDVKRTSLDMMARHIKHHLLRLDLYGKKFRGSNSLKILIDRYRPDLRNLKQDANKIAKEQNWYEALKDYL